MIGFACRRWLQTKWASRQLLVSIRMCGATEVGMMWSTLGDIGVPGTTSGCTGRPHRWQVHP